MREISEVLVNFKNQKKIRKLKKILKKKKFIIINPNFINKILNKLLLLLLLLLFW
jgi:hypothetical protein